MSSGFYNFNLICTMQNSGIINRFHFFLLCSTGKEFLKVQFIIANKRDKLFWLVIGSTCFGYILIQVVIILTQNEFYSTYQLVSNEFHWLTSIMAFSVFAVVEAFLALDLVTNIIFNFFPLYFCCLSIKYWMEKIW